MKRFLKPRLNLWFAAAAVGLAAVCVPAQAVAEETDMCLHVKLKSGKTEEFKLASKPVLTFSETECFFAADGYEVSHLMSDIENAYFAVSSGVAEAGADTVSVDLSQPGHAIVRGLEPGTPVSLYDMEGRGLAAAVADGTGMADLDMSGLQGNTVYVVSITNINNFKIYKR